MQREKEEGSRNDFVIFETNEFYRSLRKTPIKDQLYLKDKLKRVVYPQLRAQPFFGRNIKKLSNFHPETWRYRIGMYRLFYNIDTTDRTVMILTVFPRKDAY